MPTRQGSFQLFRLFGITVYLHWSWFLILVYAFHTRQGEDTSFLAVSLAVLALFLIVLMHEFGHALACKQVGGKSDQIVLWPLGGVAYVQPPQRAGAMLWSIAAGPLVNVILLLASLGLLLAGEAMKLTDHAPLFWNGVAFVIYVNWILLKFNLLPIYPLDGGQILRSLLWFAVGKARSMMIAAVIGFIGIAILVPLVVIPNNSSWYYILTAFVGFECWMGFQQARLLMKIEKLPRREGFACPKCKTSPPAGAFWRCSQCRQPFDTFETRATCPHCGKTYSETTCSDCGTAHPFAEWQTGGPTPPPLP